MEAFTFANITPDDILFDKNLMEDTGLEIPFREYKSTMCKFEFVPGK